MVKKDKDKEVEAIKLTKSDIGIMPDRFQKNGEVRKLVAGWNWAWYQEDREKPPIHYLREFHPDGFSANYGIIRLGDSVLKDKVGLEHYFKMSPESASLYEIDKGVYDYAQKSSDGLVECHFSENTAYIREGDILDLHYEYFPYAMLVNENGALGSNYIHQHALIRGTYEGKEVRMLGGWDRTYGGFTSLEQGNLFAGMSFAGIRENGCRESGFVAKVGNRGIGFFYRDGEEPVVSSEVTMEATWKLVPYVKGRKLYVYDEAVFRFGGKEIHYHAKWGFIGQNYAIHEESSMSQSSGKWYEGQTPYKFKDSFVFAECHNAHKECIEAAGFQI